MVHIYFLAIFKSANGYDFNSREQCNFPASYHGVYIFVWQRHPIRERLSNRSKQTLWRHEQLTPAHIYFEFGFLLFDLFKT